MLKYELINTQNKITLLGYQKNTYYHLPKIKTTFYQRDQLHELFAKIQKILINLKKNPNRTDSKTSTDNKLKETLEIKNNKLSQPRIKKFNEIYVFSINCLAQTKLIEEPKMADLNLKLDMKIIPVFTNQYKDVAIFLKCIELMHKTLKHKAKI